MSKKLIKIMIIGAAVFAVLFGTLWIISLFRGEKLAFNKIENKMVDAAESYYKKNPKLLPVGEYSSVELDVSTLNKEKYMKTLDKYVDDNVSCTGKVIVLKNKDNYAYIPKLNCGDAYNTKTLSETIKNSTNIVTEGEGLYEINDEYVYRGEKLNNYVSFAGRTWRILRITKDNEIRLIQDDVFDKAVWDNHYNTTKKASSGINSFEINGVSSRIKEKLDEIYLGDAFSSEAKAKLVPKKLCVGKRYYEDNTSDGSTECDILTDDYYSIGLLQINEYIASSLDVECKGINTRSCTNYNFLATYEGSFWTLTANAENTHEVYYIDYLPSSVYANRKYGLKLAVNVSGEINYTKGDGTLKNPYVID